MLTNKNNESYVNRRNKQTSKSPSENSVNRGMKAFKGRRPDDSTTNTLLPNQNAEPSSTAEEKPSRDDNNSANHNSNANIEVEQMEDVDGDKLDENEQIDEIISKHVNRETHDENGIKIGEGFTKGELDSIKEYIEKLIREHKPSGKRLRHNRMNNNRSCHGNKSLEHTSYNEDWIPWAVLGFISLFLFLFVIVFFVLFRKKRTRTKSVATSCPTELETQQNVRSDLYLHNAVTNNKNTNGIRREGDGTAEDTLHNSQMPNVNPAAVTNDENRLPVFNSIVDRPSQPPSDYHSSYYTAGLPYNATPLPLANSS